MKIKMRSDDVSTPDRNEWAEMNDWLAELKDETQADEGRDGQASLTGVGDAEPASGPGPTHGVRAVHDRQRASDARPVSDTSAVSDPRAAGNARPVQDPRPGSDKRPIHDPRAASNPRPVQDPRPIHDPRAASNPRPVQDPRAARQARPAGDANGRTPAPAPMRALIGDELRMPIMWCEMGYCISWHADPSALGEADNRARAIQAGWRIDALGRMTCPQCQQTAVAFRATRPVVLWDRATAMAMAARAAAPRYRTMGTAGRASDRRPRPAVGHQ
jgi:hypothetical protein